MTDDVNRLGVALADELATRWNGNPWGVSFAEGPPRADYALNILAAWQQDHDGCWLAQEIKGRFAPAFAVGQAVAMSLDASLRYPAAIKSIQAKMYGWIEHAALNRLREIAGLPQVHGPGCECPR